MAVRPHSEAGLVVAPVKLKLVATLSGEAAVEALSMEPLLDLAALLFLEVLAVMQVTTVRALTVQPLLVAAGAVLAVLHQELAHVERPVSTLCVVPYPQLTLSSRCN
jgi:hypothetical protein